MVPLTLSMPMLDIGFRMIGRHVLIEYRRAGNFVSRTKIRSMRVCIWFHLSESILAGSELHTAYIIR
jgi:hypothetical protein